MTSARVLVVSSSAGHGHVMVARALTGGFRKRHPILDTAHVDALDRSASWFRRSYQWGYVAMADRAPVVWRVVYDATNREMSPVGHIAARFGGQRFIRLVERWQPDAVVCTHFLGGELLERKIKKSRIATRLHMVVTDYDVHRMWYWPSVQNYFVASDLVRARLCLRYGVPEDRVHVTGIPVRPQFLRSHDPVAVRARYGLDPDRPIVLFLSGGFAAGPMRQAILGIWMERRDAQILAVCGRNARLRRAVNRLPRPAGATLHALGFVDNVAEIMEVADLVVTKGGGATISECIAMGKPIIVSAAIPGQEERNVHALAEAGAGIWAPTPEEVRWRVSRLLSDPDQLGRMARASRAFAHPDATSEIVDRVAGELVEPDVGRPHFHGAPDVL